MTHSREMMNLILDYIPKAIEADVKAFQVRTDWAIQAAGPCPVENRQRIFEKDGGWQFETIEIHTDGTWKWVKRGWNRNKEAIQRTAKRWAA